MRVERDVTGKANFVMWHARAKWLKLAGLPTF